MVTYNRCNGNSIIEVPASAILRNPLTVSPNAAITRTERQQFSIDLSDLIDEGIAFLPIIGDIITTESDDQQYEVIQEDDDSPVYQYITADRSTANGRILITTQRLVVPVQSTFE